MAGTTKTPTKTYPTSAMCAADRRAVAYAALEKAAKKRSDRDLLFAGAKYAVDLVIAGKIGRGAVKETVKGTLDVGEDQMQVRSEAVDTAELLAVVTESLTKPARDRLFSKLRDTFKHNGRLPCDEVVLIEAKALLKELRAETTKSVRGNVVFTPAPSP